MVRPPGQFAAQDFASSSWNMLSLNSPARMFPNYDANHVLSALGGYDGFSVLGGTMSVDAAGNATGNMGGMFTASFSGYSGGQVMLLISPSGGSRFPMPFAINLAKDVMVGLSRTLTGEDNQQQFLLLTRSPAVTFTSELRGVWRVLSYKVPRQMSLVKDANNVVTDIQGRNDFGTSGETVVVGHDGSFFASGIKPGSGRFALAGAGRISVTGTNLDGAPVRYTFNVNARKDFLAATGQDSTQQELILMTKAADSGSRTKDFGMQVVASPAAVDIYWASGEGRLLESSTDLKTWAAVPGTQGQHRYSSPNTGQAPRFFRVAE
jgi:hypothetical protein